MNEMFVCEITAVYRKKKNIKKVRLSSNAETIKLIRRVFPKSEINHYESFGAIFLDNALNVIGYKILSKGGINGTVVDIRLLFQNALICNATRIIIFHNHPSGNVNPSIADIELKKRIKKAGKLLDINLIDSIIITEDSYYCI